MLDWLYRLRCGNRGIKNLMRYVVIISAIIYALQFIGIYLYTFLYLDPQLVLHGQVWRLVTFLFLMPAGNIFFAAFVFYFYYIIGESLEQEWGTFVFTVYYFLGALVSIIISFATGMPITSAVHINLSLFLAFGYLYPNHTIYLFMIIPIKMKYISAVYWFFIAYSVITQPTLAGKLYALAGVVSFILFFCTDIIRRIKQRKFASKNKVRFQKKVQKASHLQVVRHRCEVCNRTELDDPDLEFRYCSKCSGYHEYCLDHINNHEHIVE